MSIAITIQPPNSPPQTQSQRTQLQEPSSPLDSHHLESRILIEYERRSWTNSAKSTKYVKIYSLLQQANRPGTQQTLSSGRQAQFRNLMAHICLSKLLCPVSAALHSIEASLGFMEYNLTGHAAQCLKFSIGAIQLEKPKYGSIASAITNFRQPLQVPMQLHLTSTSHTTDTSETSTTSSSGYELPSNYDASHTLNDTRTGARFKPLHPGIFMKNSSATFGPSRATSTLAQTSTASIFQASPSESPMPSLSADASNGTLSLQRFFQDRSTSSSSPFTSQLAYLFLRLVLHICHGLTAKEDVIKIALLDSVLALSTWLAKPSTKLTLPAASTERTFEFSSVLLSELFTDLAVSDPSVTNIAQLTGRVRMELAYLHLTSWLSRYEENIHTKLTPVPFQHAASMPHLTKVGSPPKTTTTATSSSTNNAANDSLLESCSKLFLVTVSESSNWLLDRPSSPVTDSATSSETLTLLNRRCTTLLLAHLVTLLAHSHSRLHMTTSQIQAYDRANILIPRGSTQFGAHVYTPLVVHEFEKLLEIKKDLTTTSSVASSSSPSSSSYLHNCRNVLRQCWSFVRLAHGLTLQLNDLFGQETQPISPPATLISPVSSPASASSVPINRARSVIASNHLLNQLRHARRQMHLTLKNGILDEFDACIKLFMESLTKQCPNATICTSSSSSTITSTAGGTSFPIRSTSPFPSFLSLSTSSSTALLPIDPAPFLPRIFACLKHELQQLGQDRVRPASEP